MYAVTPFAVQSKEPPRKNFLRGINHLFQLLNRRSGFSYLSEGLSVLKGV